MKKIRNILIGSLFCVILLTVGLVGCGDSIAGTYQWHWLYDDSGDLYTVEEFLDKLKDDGAPRSYVEQSRRQAEATFIELKGNGEGVFQAAINEDTTLIRNFTWTREDDKIIINLLADEYYEADQGVFILDGNTIRDEYHCYYYGFMKK